MEKPWKVITYYKNRKKTEKTGEDLIKALVSTEESLQKFREKLLNEDGKNVQ